MDSRVRFALEAIASHWIPRTAWILFAALLLALAALGLTQNVYSWTGETPPGGINSIDVWKMGMVIGSAGTAIAFLATLYIARRSYLLGREHIPHLTMNLSIERVASSKTYDVIVASLEAQNRRLRHLVVDEDSSVTAKVIEMIQEGLERRGR